MGICARIWYNFPMPDESSTPPADVQTPSSEPVSAPVTEPTPPPQEAAPALEATPLETPAKSEVSEPVPEPTHTAQSNPQSQQSSPAPTVPAPHGDIVKARAKIQETKHKKLDKIMAMLTEKGRITNDDVEKLLHVSDATATRYLQSLEKENKIKQTGSTGTGVFYEKIWFERLTPIANGSFNC